MNIDSTPMPLVPGAPAHSTTRELREAAEAFEAIFINAFMKTARSASLGEDLMGSNAVSAARDMYETEITKLASSRAGLGIADAIERQFKSFVDIEA